MREIVFPISQSGSPDTPEWHAWRGKGVGGSDAPVIAADAGLVSRASWMPTVHQLWEQKLGLRSRPKMNPAMARGRDNEEAARHAYEKITGNVVASMFGEMDVYPELRSSFDGVSFNQKKSIEIKVPGKDTHDAAKNGVVPDYYEAQMAHQGLVLWGIPSNWAADVSMDYVSYNPESDECVIVSYSYDNPEATLRMARLRDLATKMLPKLLEFWKHVELKTPPGQQMDEWSVAAHDYRRAEEAEAIARAAREEAREKLIALMGNSSKRSGAGVTVSIYSKSGATDYKRLLDDVVDREKIDKVLSTMIMDENIRKSMLDKCKITDDKIKTYKGPESIHTKITVEKDYVAPIADPLTPETIPFNQNSMERTYAW